MHAFQLKIKGENTRKTEPAKEHHKKKKKKNSTKKKETKGILGQKNLPHWRQKQLHPQKNKTKKTNKKQP